MDVKEASRKTWAKKKKSCRKAKVTKERSQYKPNLKDQKHRKELEQKKNRKFVDRAQRRLEIAVQQTEMRNEEGLNVLDDYRFQPARPLPAQDPEPVQLEVPVIEPIQVEVSLDQQLQLFTQDAM